MNYKGKVIVKNDEGIREEHEWGVNPQSRRRRVRRR